MLSLVNLRQGKRRLDDAEGVALGLWQMEPRTYDDLWTNYLAHHPDLAQRISPFVKPPAERLCTDLLYACRMARVHYYRRPEPLPPANDPDAMAAYWKAFYNTEAGKGHPKTFARLFSQHVLTQPAP